jgi:hypothetical protein
MCSEKQAIEILQYLLHNKDKWVIETHCPDGMEEIAEKAAIEADKRLSSISYSSLYRAFLKWDKSNPILRPEDDFFLAFLGDLAFNIGVRYLKGVDRIIFEDCCFFTVRFIN